MEKLRPLHSCLSSEDLDKALDQLTIALVKHYGPDISGMDAVAMLSAGAAGLRAVGYKNMEISLLFAEILLMIRDLTLEAKEPESEASQINGEPNAGKES